MRKHKTTALMTAAVLAAAGRAYAATAVDTFYDTGANQTFVVPAKVTSVDFYLWGAGGGGDYTGENKTSGEGTPTDGGGAAFVSGVFAVTPGQSLGIVVGGAATGPTGGFGGGGNGSNALGGGGRSAITISGADDIDAGGGGAGGADPVNPNYPNLTASDGGGAGVVNGVNAAGAGGFGATATAGGAGGASQPHNNDLTYPGTAGSQYQGGNAGYQDAAGGGGGYYGGGGGGAYVSAINKSGQSSTMIGGGGGGSSFYINLTSSDTGSSNGTAPGGTTNTYYQAGIGTGGIGDTAADQYGGNGLIVLTYTIQANDWLPDAGGYLDTPSNWDTGVNPSGINGSVYLGPVVTAHRSVFIEPTDVLGVIQFDSPYGYSLVNVGTPNDNLTMQVSSGSAAISATAGTTNYLDTSLELASNTSISTAQGTAITVYDKITGTGQLTVTGGGKVVFLPGSSISVPVVNNGLMVFNASTPGSGIAEVTLPSLTVGVNSELMLANSGAGNSSSRMLLDISSLAFSSSTSGVIDLGDNDMIVASPTGSLVHNKVKAGFDGGTWNGPSGIISSAAAADTTHLTALAITTNDHGTNGLFNAVNPFDGVVPGINDILVKYTYYGDANLDGQVDGSDYTLIDNGYLNHLDGWYNGDFNYDDVIDGSDYTLIDNAFNMQGGNLNSTALIASSTAQIASAGSGLSSQAVPEPAALTLLGIGVTGLLNRRRRRRS